MFKKKKHKSDKMRFRRQKQNRKHNDNIYAGKGETDGWVSLNLTTAYVGLH